MRMNIDWTVIDDYFSQKLAPDARKTFENQLRTDPETAEAVAFYLSARQVARQTSTEQRKAELLHRSPHLARRAPWPYALAAAACLVLLLGIGWVLWFQKPAASELADDYINRNLTQLSVTMGSGSDSLQRSLDLINGGKINEADEWLADMLKRQPNQPDVLKWAGVVALRRGQYDLAISRFSQLGRRTDLYANPGVFYEALARLKRNQPDDKNTAKELLQTVISKNLDGSTEARQLLDQLE